MGCTIYALIGGFEICIFTTALRRVLPKIIKQPALAFFPPPPPPPAERLLFELHRSWCGWLLYAYPGTGYPVQQYNGGARALPTPSHHRGSSGWLDGVVLRRYLHGHGLSTGGGASQSGDCGHGPAAHVHITRYPDTVPGYPDTGIWIPVPGTRYLYFFIFLFFYFTIRKRSSS